VKVRGITMLLEVVKKLSFIREWDTLCFQKMSHPDFEFIFV